MTDKATDVTVTQADRDAAAALIAWHNKASSDWKTDGGNDLTFFAADMPDAIRKGVWDGHDVVQAFARHRTASEQPASGETIDPDDLETLIDDAISDSFELDWTSMRGARAVVGALEHVGWSVVKGRPLSTTSEAPEAGRLREALEAMLDQFDADEFGSEGQMQACSKARAALTPSALSGDAGEGERLEHARAALQRVRDRFTNIGNSSPLWCDMAEDMDAYAAEGLDRSKARA